MSLQPLELELRDELSDEAVATLIECLYAFAEALESRYFAQLHAYYRCSIDESQLSLFEEERARR